MDQVDVYVHFCIFLVDCVDEQLEIQRYATRKNPILSGGRVIRLWLFPFGFLGQDVVRSAFISVIHVVDCSKRFEFRTSIFCNNTCLDAFVIEMNWIESNWFVVASVTNVDVVNQRNELLDSYLHHFYSQVRATLSLWLFRNRSLLCSSLSLIFLLSLNIRQTDNNQSNRIDTEQVESDAVCHIADSNRSNVGRGRQYRTDSHDALFVYCCCCRCLREFDLFWFVGRIFVRWWTNQPMIESVRTICTLDWNCNAQACLTLRFRCLT